jgi:uncharacterized LabA/DUF88 family protein
MTQYDLNMQALKELRLAVLIDADNIPSRHVNAMMEEIARYGTPTFKRIYGDWTKPNLAGWKQVLLENAITPVQQYSYTSGKNSTDSAMIIDAMDILYSNKVNGFCIVSSDSDFTRLATRLREAGMRVIGIGEKKTPPPFIVACDKFIYLDILVGALNLPVPEKEKRRHVKRPKEIKKVDPRAINIIAGAIDDVADENGWAYLGEVGNLIVKKFPDFDSRNFGFLKLANLIRASNSFEIDERETGHKNTRHIYIRNID